MTDPRGIRVDKHNLLRAGPENCLAIREDNHLRIPARGFDQAEATAGQPSLAGKQHEVRQRAEELARRKAGIETRIPID